MCNRDFDAGVRSSMGDQYMYLDDDDPSGLIKDDIILYANENVSEHCYPQEIKVNDESLSTSTSYDWITLTPIDAT